jgi:glycosyltransferase involved in cell wall biosynthesis
VPRAPRPIVLAANSSWNIVNFRGSLIRALEHAGYRPIVIAPHDAEAEPRMAAIGVERFALPIDRSGLNPLTDFRLLLAYCGLLKRLRPAAFLGFTIKPNIYGCLAAGSLGIPAIPNVSGLGTAFIRSGPLQLLVTNLYRAAFRKAAVVLFQNADDCRLFVDRGIVRPEKTRVVPGSGIDLDRFSPVPQPTGPTIFLLVSRLLGDKGVREYVEAARLLRERLPEARFQLLGPIDEGNRTAIRRDEVSRWVTEGLVEYLGSKDDVRPHIASASAIVLPSYREGLPRSLLEGAAMARPLIATDVPGCREVVEDGVNGFLCAARDPASLAGAMAKLAGLPASERQAMGLASRRKVQERFNETVVIRAYLDELSQLWPRNQDRHV